jgi:hypothetical protein
MKKYVGEKKKNNGDESMSTTTCKFLPMPTCLVSVLFLKHLHRPRQKISLQEQPLLHVGSVLTPLKSGGIPKIRAHYAR